MYFYSRGGALAIVLYKGVFSLCACIKKCVDVLFKHKRIINFSLKITLVVVFYAEYKTLLFVQSVGQLYFVNCVYNKFLQLLSYPYPCCLQHIISSLNPCVHSSIVHFCLAYFCFIRPLSIF